MINDILGTFSTITRKKAKIAPPPWGWGEGNPDLGSPEKMKILVAVMDEIVLSTSNPEEGNGGLGTEYEGETKQTSEARKKEG